MSTARGLYDQASGSQMNLTTQFAYPPAGDQDPGVASSGIAMHEQGRSPENPNIFMGDLEPVLLDDLFPVFPDYGIDWPNDGYNI